MGQVVFVADDKLIGSVRGRIDKIWQKVEILSGVGVNEEAFDV